MILVEQHIIKQSIELDNLTFKCKNLYNRANYLIRQEFIDNGNYISKISMFNLLKDDDDYKSIGSTRVARCVLRTLDANWISFFGSIKQWRKNPSKFKGKPNLPKYLPKNSKFTAIFIDTSILKPKKNKPGIGLSTLNLRINTKIPYDQIIEVSVKPMNSGKYKINIAYNYNEIKIKNDNKNYCSIDLGVNNLMTLTSNKQGLNPLIINGRPLKSINQYYNKMKAEYQSSLPDKVKSSKKIIKLTEKRNNKVNDYLHKSSDFLIKHCLDNDLNTIVIGYNEFWKQKINIGKKNNQNFVQIPFHKLVWMIEYKSIKHGINILKDGESYTSKCSFLDLEEIKKHDEYLGYRSSRGMFKSKKYGYINADVNGSLNILRKVVPNVFINGIEGVAVHPKRIKSFK